MAILVAVAPILKLFVAENKPRHHHYTLKENVSLLLMHGMCASFETYILPFQCDNGIIIDITSVQNVIFLGPKQSHASLKLK